MKAYFISYLKALEKSQIMPVGFCIFKWLLRLVLINITLKGDNFMIRLPFESQLHFSYKLNMLIVNIWKPCNLMRFSKAGKASWYVTKSSVLTGFLLLFFLHEIKKFFQILEIKVNQIS